MLGFDFSKKSSLGVFVISMVMAVSTLAIYFSGIFNDLENISQDWRTKVRYQIHTQLKSVPISNEVCLAGIEKNSIDPLYSKFSDRWGEGRWRTRENWYAPFPYLIQFFQPKVVAYDILFPQNRSKGQKEYEQASEDIEKYFKDHKIPLKELFNLEDFPLSLYSTCLDEVSYFRFCSFVMSVYDSEGPPIVFGFNFTRSEKDNAETWRLNPEIEERLAWLRKFAISDSCIRNRPADFPLADNAQFPPKIFANTPVSLGNIAVSRDPDTKVRRVPLVDGYIDPSDKKTYLIPSLSLQACLNYLKIPANTPDPQGKAGILINFGKEIHLWSPNRDIHIPIDAHGNLLLNFEAKIRDFPQVPYIDILKSGQILENEAAADPGSVKLAKQAVQRIQNKIMVVGTSATALGDIGGCSIDDNMPFVFIHLTALDNILRGSYLILLPPFLTIIFLISCPLLVGFWTLLPSARFSTLGTISLFCGIEAGAFILFYFFNLLIPMVLPAFAISLTFGFNSIYVYQVERKGRLEIRKRFSAMVSPRVLQYMEEHPESLTGERRDATMFFSDVAGFTSISESLAPEKLSQILNDYLTPMTNIILARDGYVNKYAGDGIMAVWGVPYHSTDHAIQSCLAAIEQQQKITELIPFFEKEYNVKLHVRMGINTGTVSAGNMGSRGGDGSPERYEYTVMGDAVNFAARLEPSNKDYHTLIMIGVNTYEQAKDGIVARKLDKLGVYGKKEAVLVYELVGEKGKVEEKILKVIQHFETGLDLYWKRNFSEALKQFEVSLQVDSTDYPSQVFVERCQDFIKNPPPPEWGGEYVRKSK